MKIIRNRIYKLFVIAVVLSSFTPVALVSTGAKAAFIDSQMITPDGAVSTDRQLDEKKVRQALENKIVVEKLSSYGLSKQEVVEKMARMSDAEVHQIAALSDRIPAGGNAVGLVVGVLIIFVLVLLVLFLVQRV